jgi:hypothetical protein
LAIVTCVLDQPATLGNQRLEQRKAMRPAAPMTKVGARAAARPGEAQRAMARH